MIWAPSYTERAGGVMVLHYLCHYLNSIGYRSTIWHSDMLTRSGNSWQRKVLYLLKKVNRIRKGIKRTSASLNTPIASHDDLNEAIVVYPETISGNPLRASKVVRWFLHRPGYHNTRTNYGDNERYFYYQVVFNYPPNKYHPCSEFRFSVLLENTFKQTNFGERKGTCFILRKGRNREIQHNLSDGIIIDHLTNEEISEVFNKSEYCISYDMYTFYSKYAALCGCKSIVVPEAGLEKTVWQPREEFRYGVAYGEEDLPWALATRSQMISNMRAGQSNNLPSVRAFAKECIDFFRD